MNENKFIIFDQQTLFTTYDNTKWTRLKISTVLVQNVCDESINQLINENKFNSSECSKVVI